VGESSQSSPFKKFGVASFNYSMSILLYVILNQVSSFR